MYLEKYFIGITKDGKSLRSDTLPFENGYNKRFFNNEYTSYVKASKLLNHSRSINTFYFTGNFNDNYDQGIKHLFVFNKVDFQFHIIKKEQSNPIQLKFGHLPETFVNELENRIIKDYYEFDRNGTTTIGDYVVFDQFKLHIVIENFLKQDKHFSFINSLAWSNSFKIIDMYNIVKNHEHFEKEKKLCFSFFEHAHQFRSGLVSLILADYTIKDFNKTEHEQHIKKHNKTILKLMKEHSKEIMAKSFSLNNFSTNDQEYSLTLHLLNCIGERMFLLYKKASLVNNRINRDHNSIKLLNIDIENRKNIFNLIKKDSDEFTIMFKDRSDFLNAKIKKDAKIYTVSLNTAGKICHYLIGDNDYSLPFEIDDDEFYYISNI